MNNNIAPAQLWIGSAEFLRKEAIRFLQKQYCSKQGCGTCHTCQKINIQQHHCILWLAPDKQYTLNLLEPIFKTITFSNEQNALFFFILDKADVLTAACANSLLKSVEEPPPGYHFIFLAQRSQAILPTIKSRCIIKTFQEQQVSIKYEPFLHHFKTITEPFSFLQTLDSTQPNERESLELIDTLLNYWNQQYLKLSTKKTEQIIMTLQEAIQKPPMPGGSKIFWKNLYLRVRLLGLSSF